MTPPDNTTQIRSFIDLVNYYMDIWDRQSHLIQSFTEITSNKVKFKWKYVEQKAFDDVKHVVTRNTLLSYPYFNKHFDIHMHAIN